MLTSVRLSSLSSELTRNLSRRLWQGWKKVRLHLSLRLASVLVCSSPSSVATGLTSRKIKSMSLEAIDQFGQQRIMLMTRVGTKGNYCLITGLATVNHVHWFGLELTSMLSFVACAVADVMMLGFISLMLVITRDSLAKICVPDVLSDHMLPCPEPAVAVSPGFSVAKCKQVRQSSRGFLKNVSFHMIHTGPCSVKSVGLHPNLIFTSFQAKGRKAEFSRSIRAIESIKVSQQIRAKPKCKQFFGINRVQSYILSKTWAPFTIH